MKRLSIFLLVCFYSLTTIADNTEIFKVLAANGIVLLERSSNKENWKPLKVGSKLFQNDKLIITEGSYLGLVHSSGKALELREAGVYLIKDLSGNIKQQQAGLAKKYLDYILADLTTSNDGDGYRQNMGITGSVERGHGEQSDFKLFIPEKTHLFDKTLHISWEKIDGAKKYEVVLKNMFEEEISRVEATDSFTIVDLNSETLEEEQYYSVQVIAKNMESSKINVFFPHQKDLEVLKDDLQELRTELDYNSSLTHMILASFYEENNFYLDALLSYRKAIEIAPEVEEFHNLYKAFLLRHDLMK